MGRPQTESVVIEGENLTQRLLDDFKPYLKEEFFPRFIALQEKNDEKFGPVTRIEMFRSPRPNDDGRFFTKWYWRGKYEYDPESPDIVFDAAMAGILLFPD